MVEVFKWLKTAVDNLVDPEKQQRIDALASHLERGLVKQQTAFSVAQALVGYDHSISDLIAAKELIYRRALQRGWADGLLNAKEQSSANWIARSLQMPAENARAINVTFARNHFGNVLARAIQRRSLNEQDLAHLSAIVTSIGTTVELFAPQFFSSECEELFRAVFDGVSDCVETLVREWPALLAVAQRLGFAHSGLYASVQAQSQKFVEHLLVDAKADSRLTEAEESSIRSSLQMLGLGGVFGQYVERELWELKTQTNIADGKLPVIPRPTNLETRPGETVHLFTPATWIQRVVRRNGVQDHSHEGILTITDVRLVFSSPTKAQNFAHRRVVSHDGTRRWIEVQIDGKTASRFLFVHEIPFAYPIYRSAVAIANQTKAPAIDGMPTRHIPREVRQRVWQHYGGKCANCGASDYLEFDHIIPVAKGGSNTESNVQVLCRRCNLKKSDNL